LGNEHKLVGNAVPIAGDDVRIDGTASNVTVSTGANATRSALSLTIDAGDALQIDNNSTMNLGETSRSTGR